MNVFMPADIISFLRPIDQGVILILIFKSYHLKNISHKAIAAVGNSSLVDLGKANWKPSGKDSPFQMPLTASVIHRKKSKYQHHQELGRS